MNGKPDQSNEVRFGIRCIRHGYRQRTSLLEQHDSKVLKDAGDHQPCVLQVQTLGYRAREVERFRDNFIGSRAGDRMPRGTEAYQRS